MKRWHQVSNHKQAVQTLLLYKYEEFNIINVGLLLQPKTEGKDQNIKTV